MKIEKVSKTIFIAMVMCMLMIPALFTNVQKNQTSDMDNRMLVEFPEMDSGFTMGIENYLKDRVGFRNKMITMYQILCDKCFQISVHPSYDFGDNGQIYAVWDLVTYQHLDTNGYENDLSRYLKNIQDVCEDLGADFIFMIAPNKESIYYEDFPRGYNIKAQPNRTDLIIESLLADEVPFLDVRGYFLQIKDRVHLYNDKYDAGHWNADGLYNASKLLYERLQQMYPEMGEWNKDDYERREIEAKYLMQSFFPIHEYVPAYSLREDKTIQNDEIFSVINPNGWAMHYKNTVNGDGKPSILILGDSFLNAGNIDTFFKKHCSEFTRIHSYNISDLSYFITTFQPDVVIIEAAERVFQNRPWSSEDISNWQYTLNILNNHIVERCGAEEIGLNGADTIYKICKTETGNAFINVIGCYEKYKEQKVQALIAIANGKQYIAKYNPEDGQYIFTFRLNDLQESSEIEFFKVVE